MTIALSSTREKISGYFLIPTDQLGKPDQTLLPIPMLPTEQGEVTINGDETADIHVPYLRGLHNSRGVIRVESDGSVRFVTLRGRIHATVNDIHVFHRTLTPGDKISFGDNRSYVLAASS